MVFQLPTQRYRQGRDHSFAHSLGYGQLPLAYTSPKPGKFLQSYIETYLREEVLQEGLTRNIGNFTRFLEVASFSQGQIMNISRIAQEAQVERKTAENYFRILEDLLVGLRLDVFNKRAKRKLAARPKFYYFDAGVFRALRPAGPLDSESEIDGPALETLLLQEMRALNDYLELGYRFYYWRSVTGLEVDFVLYGPRGLMAFEIKRKPVITGNDLRGIKAFARDYPQARSYVLCSASRKEHRGNIEILPIKKTLHGLKDILIQGNNGR